MDVTPYKPLIEKAIRTFWETRQGQKVEQAERGSSDQGNRGAVTGGKHLDGFIDLLVQVAKDLGVHERYITTKNNILPGFYRPSKNWDLLIVTPANQLICAVEFKSQVGSIGNNFNNRVEEAIGNGVDLNTSVFENSFPFTTPPWVGFLHLLEYSDDTSRIKRIDENLYKARPEFYNTNTLQRYDLFCKKVIQKRIYNAAALIWTKSDHSFGEVSYETSIDFFLKSFMANIELRKDDR